MRNKSLSLVMLLCLFLFACASNSSIRLLYNPNAPTVLPEANAPTVVVVLFEDKRNSADIGTKRDGSPFVSINLVNEWASRALADELGRKGLQVSFSPTVAAARNANPDYIVTGSVNETWVTEQNPTTYSASINISYTLSNKKGVAYSENISSSQERSGITGNKLAEDVLSECLRNVVTKASAKISELCFART